MLDSLETFQSQTLHCAGAAAVARQIAG